MNLSIVIPAYNEADNIRATIDEIFQNLSALSSESITAEIVVVDDHSSDNTFPQVEKLGDTRVRVIRLSRRSGSHIALRVGLDVANGDAAICLSADGQDDPNALAAMITEWKAGRDIVWALRRSRENESLAQQLFARAFYFLLGWFGGGTSKIDLSRADFYLLDRKVINAVKACRERNTSLFGLLVWVGFDQGCVEYDRRSRRSGGSKWNFRSRLQLAQDWIIAFSGLPLKLMTMLGFSISCVGFLYAFYVVIHSLLHGSPLLGWSSIMTAILLLGGGQIMMLGIIGEYLWRTLDESRDRPAYFIDHDTGGNNVTPSLARRRMDLGPSRPGRINTKSVGSLCDEERPE